MRYSYDIQVHTSASPCSRASPKSIVSAANKAGLSGIVITDHDTMENVRETQKVAPSTLEVIPGVEITTDCGHLLAIGVYEPPPPSDIKSVIDNIHTQGGFAIPSHPFDPFRESCGNKLRDVVNVIDGVETINSRCLRRSFNETAVEFSTRHNIPSAGGSDAHFSFEIGRAMTITRVPLLEALSRGETAAVGRGRYLTGHLATKLNEFLPV